MVYDGDDREGETDLFFPAQHATPAAIGRLRNEAGGLVFVAIGPELHEALGLPFLHDLFEHAGKAWPILEGLSSTTLPYDARSSFSITLNHRESFTGITDADRSLTVTTLGKIASLEACIAPEELQERFTAAFRTPGHVHLCSAAPGLVTERRGHTELAIVLARLAGIPEAVAGAEILHGEGAMSPGHARERAEALGVPFVTGAEILQAWQTIQEMDDPIAADA